MLLPLLWKDIRLNRWVILLTVFLIDTPYLTTAFGLSAFTGDPETNTSMTERMSIAFPFSLLFLTVASAFIGGSPIASEKAERTDRFLAYLPPTRQLVVTSKVLTALGLLLLAWIGPLVVYFSCVKPMLAGKVLSEGSRIGLYYAVSTSLILFGLAWLISLFSRSSTVCGLAAFVGWLVVMTIVRRGYFIFHPGKAELADMIGAMLWTSVVIVVVAMISGILLSLRTPTD